MAPVSVMPSRWQNSTPLPSCAPRHGFSRVAAALDAFAAPGADPHLLRRPVTDPYKHAAKPSKVLAVCHVAWVKVKARQSPRKKKDAASGFALSSSSYRLGAGPNCLIWGSGITEWCKPGTLMRPSMCASRHQMLLTARVSLCRSSGLYRLWARIMWRTKWGSTDLGSYSPRISLSVVWACAACLRC